MPGLRQGSIHLFRVAGIDLFLHWSWFVVAAIEVVSRWGSYSSVAWNILEYLALFSIVLLHEFGHALACRQVGGTADRIVLWPLGGVAFVNPPKRPGAMLWSIAAGPFVNVLLIPVLLVASSTADAFGLTRLSPDLRSFLDAVIFINVGLLIFNLLPVYPLDGGQILRSLLWFVMGRGRSLAATTIVGFAGIAALVGLAFWMRRVWLLLLCGYMLINCWSGLKAALVFMRQEKLPRRAGFCCPGCRTMPPLGNHWTCGRCRQPFDTFETGATCPHCGAQFDTTRCLYCLELHPFGGWVAADQPSSRLSSKDLSTTLPPA
jgi:Zn-dependent protease